MNFKSINKYKEYNLNVFLIFSLIGIILRIWISQFGSNFDFAMWQANLDIFKQGKSIHKEGMYGYGSPWIYTLYILDSISLPFIENNSFIQSIPGTFYRFKIIIFLSLIDVSIFYLLYKNYSLKVGLIYLINPISIIMTGHHNALNNYALLFGFLAVLSYGNLNEKNITFQKVFAIFLIGLSISIKHILFFFPIWWAFKEKRLINKVLIIAIPYFVFTILVFGPFYPDDFHKQVDDLLHLGRHETGPFWKLFLSEIFHRQLNIFNFNINVSYFKLTCLLLVILGFFMVNKNLKNSFYIYLLATVAFAPQMYTQYLYIPLIAISIYWNNKLAVYTLITSLLFLVDGDQLNIQFFAELLNWDLRSTRIVFYPLILILIIEFFEQSIGSKKFYSQINLVKKMIIDKVKKSLIFK
tara:strand:- start:2265 stop:3497 length:1233 start_codon:yes stop_codon:yes gene_type:complete